MGVDGRLGPTLLESVMGQLRSSELLSLTKTRVSIILHFEGQTEW